MNSTMCTAESSPAKCDNGIQSDSWVVLKCVCRAAPFLPEPVTEPSEQFRREDESSVSGIDFYNAPLAVEHLAMCCHDPHKIQLCTGNRDVRMVALRQKDSVAVANHLYLCRADSVGVDQLKPESRLGHVNEDIDFFKHRSMFVRGPACPVSR